MEEEREYSIGELADEAGVSTRTIRYYVSEGLLPPPVGSGPNSRYTEAHRDRLAIIGRLKAQYLPLKEIRRRLIGHGPVHSPASAAATRINYSRMPDPEVARFERRLLSEPAPTGSGIIEAAEPYGHHESPAMAPPPATALDRDRPWRRVSITDEAELLITEDQYRRHQDKIDWLIQWARRVLDP